MKQLYISAIYRLSLVLFDLSDRFDNRLLGQLARKVITHSYRVAGVA